MGKNLITPAPKGRDRLLWLGPIIIWIISAISAGELIFTPRISSLYGYSVLWAIILAISIKGLIAREIGRYAVVTGESLLIGIKNLPGPKNWCLWLIIIPQFFVAAISIAGMAGAASTALILLLPGSFVMWAIILILISVFLVVLGKYKTIELTAIFMIAVIAIALFFAAASVFPGLSPIAQGLIPGFPKNIEFVELLPWLGFIMSGAAGLMWYSYWLVARGYGTAGCRISDNSIRINISQLTTIDKRNLKSWVEVMSTSTFFCVLFVMTIVITLMILGTQLLRPEGLVPEGPYVTSVLSLLLGALWGPVGAWALVIASFFAFWSTIIAGMDGWGRMLSQGSVFIAEQFNFKGKFLSAPMYRSLHIFGLMGLLPIVLFFLIPQPVTLLIIAGIIEVIQIPIVALSVIYLNSKTLAPELRPSMPVVVLMLGAAMFFIFFAMFYIHQQFIGN